MYKSNSQLPGALTSLTGLAKAIALPHEFAPQRFPSFPALERTAVMGFSVPTTWSNSVASNGSKFMLARQAVYPLWGDVMTTSSWSYSITWEATTAGFLEHTTDFGPNVMYPTTSNVGATASQLGITGCNNSFVTAPVLGYDQGTGPSPWIYVPINSSLTLYVSTVGANTYATGAQATLSLQVWTAPGQFTSRTLNMTKNTTTTNFGESYAITKATALVTTSVSTGGIWVRPSTYEAVQTSNTIPLAGVTGVVSSLIAGPNMVFSNSAQATMTVAGAPADPIHLPLVIAPEISTSPLPWMACRTTAASVLLTNVTQVLNKAGTFLGGRISPNVTNPFLVPRSYIANLHPAEKQQLCAEEGFYTFSPPSTDLANFWDYTCILGPSTPSSIETTTGLPPLYRLDNDSLVNVIFFDDSAAASFSVTVDWHIEFRTSSALWQIAVSTMPLETLHSAQLLLHGVGYFFSNKWHLTLLKILNHLKTASPIFGLAYSAGKMIMSNKPQRNPKTTTLAGATGTAGPRRQRGKSKRRRRAKSAPPPRQPTRSASRPKMKSGIDMYLASKKR